MSTELKQLAEGLKSDFEKFKETHAQELAEVKKHGAATAETKQQLERLQNQLDQVEAEAKRIQTQRILDREEKGSESAEERAHKAAFLKFARKGDAKLSEAEVKALSTDSDPDGGYVVAPTISRRVTEKLIELSDMRALATVEQISGSEWQEPAEGSTDFESGWVSERASRPETDTATLRMIRIPVHEQYAAPRISQTQLDDSVFDVEGWLTRRLALRFAVKEGTAFISGDGNGKPQGINDATLVTGVEIGTGGAITTNGFMDLFYGLPEAYARNGTFLLKRTTIRDLRKLKDSNGQYLWQPALVAGQPAAILGQPYREMPDMPAVAASASCVVFGDIRAGYKVIDRIGYRTQRDPFTAKPFVEFYTTKRVGGGIVLAEALRRGTIAA